MDHDKIKMLLMDLDMRVRVKSDILASDAADLIRSLRTECDNQATRIADLDQALEKIAAFNLVDQCQCDACSAISIARAARAKPKD